MAKVELTGKQAKLVKDIVGAEGLVASLTSKLEESGVSLLAAKRSLGLAPLPGPKEGSKTATEWYGLFAAEQERLGGALSRAEAIAVLGEDKYRLKDFVTRGYIRDLGTGESGETFFDTGAPPAGRARPSLGHITDEEKNYFSQIRTPGEARIAVGPKRFDVLKESGELTKYPGGPHGSWGLPGLASPAPTSTPKPQKKDDPSVASFDEALEEDGEQVAAPEPRKVITFG